MHGLSHRRELLSAQSEERGRLEAGDRSHDEQGHARRQCEQFPLRPARPPGRARLSGQELRAGQQAASGADGQGDSPRRSEARQGPVHRVLHVDGSVGARRRRWPGISRGRRPRETSRRHHDATRCRGQCVDGGEQQPVGEAGSTDRHAEGFQASRLPDIRDTRNPD